MLKYINTERGFANHNAHNANTLSKKRGHSLKIRESNTKHTEGVKYRWNIKPKLNGQVANRSTLQSRKELN